MKTLDEVRDAIAAATGWTKPGVDLPAGPGTSWPQDPPGSIVQLAQWVRVVDGRVVEWGPTRNPIPSTLDFCAANMPEGWDWTLSKGMDVHRNHSAEAFGPGLPIKHEFVEDQPTAVEACLRLLLAVLEAEKGKEGAQ